MGDSKTLTVSTEFGDVVVRKMPLSDYAELLRALEKFPEALEKFVSDKDPKDLQKLNNAELLKVIPGLIADMWPDVVAIIAIPTDKDAAFMNKLDGADAFEIIAAIIQLNDFVRIANAVKKMLAPRTKTIETPPTPQS